MTAPPSLPLAETAVGAPGSAKTVTAFEAADGGPVPTAFVAVAVKV